jgi:hypothetical protein
MALVSVVFLSLAPYQESLFGLTFENLLLCLLTITMAFLSTRHEWAGPFCIAYAAMAKVFPAPLVLYFLARREWRHLLYCAIASVALLGVSLALFGVPAHRAYFGVVLPILLEEHVVQGGFNVGLAPLMTSVGVPFMGFRILLCLATVLIVHVSAGRDPESAYVKRLAFGFLTCAMLLLMPNCWGQYQLVLVLPIAVLVGGTGGRDSSGKGLVTVIALAAWAPMIASYNYRFCPGPNTEWVIHLRQFSPLLLWITMAGLLLARPSEANPETYPPDVP